MEMKRKFEKVTNEFLDRLREIAGTDHVLVPGDDIEPYTHDETEDLRFEPEAVVKPDQAQHVSEIMKLCSETGVPVTPRGGGTGLSGGALPVCGGLVLALERMNRILEIDTKNLMAVAEPGVITENLHNAVEDLDLFYPPDPASRGSCTLGGNLAECAGGPRTLKYGVTRDYVLGVEAVLPDGEIINTGGKLLKNVTGYNLTHLIVGSEGTLAVITKIILRLLPLPKFRSTLLAPFPSLDHATAALNSVFMNRVFPCAAEFMERDAVQAAEKMLERNFPYSDAEALLLLEVDGNDESAVQADIERAGQVCLDGGAADVLLAQGAAKQEQLWSVRRAVGEAVKKFSAYREEDTVAPRARLPELVAAIKQIAKKHGIKTICYGHAGDGNIHCNIVKSAMSASDWEDKLPVAIRELHTTVVAMGGTLSGEHGIGCLQNNNLNVAIGPAELRLMKKIKQAFDPDGMLNPGKIFPDGEQD